MSSSATSGCVKPRAVLTKDQAIDIFRLSMIQSPISKKPTATSVAKKYDISEKTIRDIWKGRTWHEETLALDLKRSPRVARKTGRPLGRKDSVPRRSRSMRENPTENKSAASQANPNDVLARTRSFSKEASSDPDEEFSSNREAEDTLLSKSQLKILGWQGENCTSQYQQIVLTQYSGHMQHTPESPKRIKHRSLDLQPFEPFHYEPCSLQEKELIQRPAIQIPLSLLESNSNLQLVQSSSAEPIPDLSSKHGCETTAPPASPLAPGDCPSSLNPLAVCQSSPASLASVTAALLSLQPADSASLLLASTAAAAAAAAAAAVLLRHINYAQPSQL